MLSEFCELYLVIPKKILSYNIIILLLINFCFLGLFCVKVIETQQAVCDFNRKYFAGGSFCQDVTLQMHFLLPEE